MLELGIVRCVVARKRICIWSNSSIAIVRVGDGRAIRGLRVATVWIGNARFLWSRIEIVAIRSLYIGMTNLLPPLAF